MSAEENHLHVPDLVGVPKICKLTSPMINYSKGSIYV